jgi:hypothetical protein
MDRVEEIKAAIESLPPEEFDRVARWVHERGQALWDRQLNHDSASGELDFLFEEAESESKLALLREWPPSA